MLVKYWMRKEVVTIGVDNSMQDAARLMKQHATPLLPVLRGGMLIGVLTDRDLKRASASDATSLEIHELAYLLSRIKVREIMSEGPITVPPDFTLEEAATVLLENNISGAPVVDETGQIVGIISQREVFQALVSLTGLKDKGVQFAFEIADAPGSIKELTDIIRSYGGRLVSILTSYDRVPEGRRRVYIRCHLIDRSKLDELRAQLQQKGELIYVVDHRQRFRKEYMERKVADLPASGQSVPVLERIVLCTDFSDNSLPARSLAIAFAKNFRAQLLILHVVNPRLLGYPAFDDHVPVDLTELKRSVDELVKENLDRVLGECQREIPTASAHLCSGEPAVEIVPFAKSQSADLIVMGTHGWTGFKHLVLGSVAENVVRTAHCPVLTVRRSRT